MASGQSQKAGENSTQIQVLGNYVVAGVTEQRAAEIAEAAAKRVLVEYETEAAEASAGRIGEFNNRLVPRFQEADLLNAFRDPSFSVLLRKAQIGAASSGQESDYDMLVGLLSDRAQRGSDRKVSAAIDRAVEVVDRLADDALAGLTVWQAFIQYSPTSPELNVGLDNMETLLGQLELDNLPTGQEWVDHLDVLGLVRPDVGLYQKHSAKDVWNLKTPGYVSVGVANDDIQAALDRHIEVCPEVAFALLEHDLKPGFHRVALPTSRARRLLLERAGHSGEVMDRFEGSLRDNFMVDTVDPALTDVLFDRANERPSLKAIQQWWDSVPQHMTVTKVGRVVARANADRLDVKKILPPLD